MRFRPCIDIHNGKVKQIVGSTLNDETGSATENFVAEKDAAYYAGLYRDKGLSGGHVIMLNKKDSIDYAVTKDQAVAALVAYPHGLMAGGGIGADNAKEFIDAGASHVIVTSFVFSDGRINMDNLRALADAVGKSRIVLDMSCRYVDGSYHVMTDRWQKTAEETVGEKLFDLLGGYCDEFLVHAIDAEGKTSGIDERLVAILAKSPRPICYAGGVSSKEDIIRLKEAGDGKVDVTVGSALDIFGGNLSIEEIVECTR